MAGGGGGGGGSSYSGKKARSRTKNRPNNLCNNNNSNNNNNNKNNNNELLYMTKNQLKNECRKRGQKTTGNKIELLQRLGVKMATTIGTNNNNNSKKKHLLTNGMSIKSINNDSSGASGDLTDKTRKEKEKEERHSLVLWKRPFITIEYFLKEMFTLIHTYGVKILGNKLLVSITALILVVSYLLVNIDGPHRVYISTAYKQILWCLYWIGLGILSSVGLGTGLHTFLLYLGPHIAQVTLAAYECESLNFPSPPYPDEIICPDDNQRNLMTISILSIMSKVRLEAMCWGAGTALGELPPYFMARAARLSGLDPDDDDDDDLKEFEQLQKKQQDHNQLTLIERGKLFIEELVKKVGFFGILACASIPNPLFDLAGITCGHFLVPFWTFFGATLIGKAVIKMHIQKLFVIIAFNETLINKALELLHYLPIIGNKLQIPFKKFLDGQKQKLHKHSIKQNINNNNDNILSFIFEKLMFAMILYFVLSLINALAQNYHKRMNKKKTKLAKD